MTQAARITGEATAVARCQCGHLRSEHSMRGTVEVCMFIAERADDSMTLFDPCPCETHPVSLQHTTFEERR